MTGNEHETGSTADRYLYADFLDDPKAYESAQQYWTRLFDALITPLGQSDEWKPYIPKHFADGTSMGLLGNPIFDSFSPRLDRGIQVIQTRPPRASDRVGAAWINNDPGLVDVNADMPTAELVLNLTLSERSGAWAESLLKKWIDPETTVALMQSYILAHEVEG